MLLDQKVYGVTARCDDNVTSFFVANAVIFSLDNCRADSSLLYIVETQLFLGIPHRFDADSVKIGDK